MREYLSDLRENWRDDYWRADHPEVQLGLMVAAFVLIGGFRVMFTLIELLLRRRIECPA